MIPFFLLNSYFVLFRLNFSAPNLRSSSTPPHQAGVSTPPCSPRDAQATMCPGSRTIVRFQLLRSRLTRASVTPANARYARFHWLWPSVELLHEERNTDCFLAACTPSPSFLHGRRLEQFPCRYESNGKENPRAFRIRSKPRRRGEPCRVQRCRR